MSTKILPNDSTSSSSVDHVSDPPCAKKSRLLNLRFDRGFATETTTPQLSILRLHKHIVLFDSNSLCTLQTTDDVAGYVEKVPGNGLLRCDRKPLVERRPSRVQAICLAVTHRCNLNCQYCFESAYPERESDMSLDNARAALRLFPEDSDMSISFFGGEPLLQFDLIRQIVGDAERMAADRKVNISFHITTNGTLLTREISEFLDAHGFSMIVSLDGEKVIHNSCRGMHAETMRGLASLSGLGITSRTTLRSTYTPGNVLLAERLRFLNGLARAGLASNISVEPVSLPPDHPLAITPQMRSTLAEEYHEAAKWVIEEVRAGRRPIFFHFDKLASRIASGSPAPTECGAGWHYISVDPAGRLHACHREGAVIGDVHSGINLFKAGAWADNSLRRSCEKCWLRYVCGGGCRSDSLQNCNLPERRWKNSPRDLPPDKTMCMIKQTIAREVLWILCELTTEEARSWLDEPEYSESLVGWATWSARFPWRAL